MRFSVAAVFVAAMGAASALPSVTKVERAPVPQTSTSPCFTITTISWSACMSSCKAKQGTDNVACYEGDGYFNCCTK